jgi:hypothetical protein
MSDTAVTPRILCQLPREKADCRQGRAQILYRAGEIELALVQTQHSANRPENG